MTELQNKLLEMLNDFHNFCKSKNISYYGIGGTLLGAVRHKGFIPWDDDIDVAMPRDDYEKFIKLKKFGKYEISHFTNDKENTYGFCKIYDPTTTYIEKFGVEGDLVKGLFIDVFPIDGVGNNYEKAVQKIKKIVFLRKLLYVNKLKGDRGNIIKNLYTKIANKLNPFKLINAIEKKLKKQKFDNSEFVVNAYGRYYEKEIVPKKYFGEPTLYHFENISIYGLEDYDKYLTWIYDDYMKLPDENNRQGHNISYVNFELPYREYKKNIESK